MISLKHGNTALRGTIAFSSRRFLLTLWLKMKLDCSVTIVNRFATNLGIKGDQKFKNAVLAIMKPPKNENVYLLLITSKNKSGTRYKVIKSFPLTR